LKSTAEHSLLSGAVVKNEWNYTPFLTNLQSMHSDLTFICLLLTTSFQNNHSSYQYLSVTCQLEVGQCKQ